MLSFSGGGEPEILATGINLLNEVSLDLAVRMNMRYLRCTQVQESHKEKTRTMEDAIKTAKQIHMDSVRAEQEL